MTFFRRKYQFSRPQFLMTFFKSSTVVFGFFLSFLKIFHIFAACNVVYDPFFIRKTTISQNNSFTTPFFTLFVLSHTFDKHYFSKYWEDGCMGRHPISNFGGTVPPVPFMSPPVNLSQ